jgi:phytoene/squalene synthetase
MSTTKETAAQRRKREREELNRAQQEREQKFEAEKSTRLLHALARAHDLKIDAQMFYRYDNVLYYDFDFSRIGLPNILDTFCDTVAELSEWMMDSIENQLKLVEESRDRSKRLANLKKEVLARLTDEEREALGLN